MLTDWLSKTPHATCSQAGVHVMVWGWLCQQRAPSLNQTRRKCCLGICLTSPTGYSWPASPVPSSPSPPPSCSAVLNVPAGFTCWINTTHWAANPTSREDGKAGALTLTQKGAWTLEPQGLQPHPPLPVEASLQQHWASPGVLPDTPPGPESSLLGLPLGLWGHSPGRGGKAAVVEGRAGMASPRRWALQPQLLT